MSHTDGYGSYVGINGARSRDESSSMLLDFAKIQGALRRPETEDSRISVPAPLDW